MGLNQKCKNTFLYRGSWWTGGPKMARFYREIKNKKQCLWQTDGQTLSDRQSQWQKNNRLLARRGDQQGVICWICITAARKDCVAGRAACHCSRSVFTVVHLQLHATLVLSPHGCANRWVITLISWMRRLCVNTRDAQYTPPTRLNCRVESRRRLAMCIDWIRD